jgi:hypothetical protein
MVFLHRTWPVIRTKQPRRTTNSRSTTISSCIIATTASTPTTTSSWSTYTSRTRGSTAITNTTEGKIYIATAEKKKYIRTYRIHEKDHNGQQQKRSCSMLTNHDRPCIWTHPISILLPRFCWTITTSATSVWPVIQFILFNKVSGDAQIRGVIRCIFAFGHSYVNLNDASMEIFIVEPLNSSWCSMLILISDCGVTLWFICSFVPIYPNFWLASSFVLLLRFDKRKWKIYQKSKYTRYYKTNEEFACGCKKCYLVVPIP